MDSSEVEVGSGGRLVLTREPATFRREAEQYPTGCKAEDPCRWTCCASTMCSL